MGTLNFAGTYTALVTPFLDDGSEGIDFPAFDALVEAQIAGGITGLVPCGTTGESPTLSHDEHEEVVKRTVERARGRVQVIAGAGSNSTREAVRLAKSAQAAGADAIMTVVPYYNKPTQEGLRQHFLAVARAVTCPVVLYNIPGRTNIDLLPDTLGKILEEAPNVVAMKEATGNVMRAQELVRRFGARLSVLSGDDALTVAMMAVGARGVISVTSNVFPREVSKVVEAAAAGDYARALKEHQALLPVHDSMFVEANPSPCKAALALRGKMKSVVRGPLAPVSDSAKKTVAAALEAFSRASS
jgi:4-hydroxy-tetrahydrodipicolinate synthase